METIAAVATAPGQGAIAVIRISGPSAFAIANAIFSRSIYPIQSHKALYGNILHEDGSVLDSVLLLVMKGPRSYTGEDTIEISCHGGQLVTRRVLERILRAGAQAAKPGEFSLRAFLNGKIDLAQAEAVQELIAAKNEQALQNAERQLEGALSEKITSYQKELTDIAAVLEAWVDFPEEDLEFATMQELTDGIEKIVIRMKKLHNTFHNGRLLQEGIELCLLGAPNVGKSSLMNALLGKERAIVTPIAGTTRDLIEEDLKIGQLHFRLKDTAGIRETDEIVEKEGIRRSKTASENADLILLLLDASRPLTQEDRQLLENKNEKTLVVWNKTDIADPTNPISGLCISALKKTGIDELSQAIEEHIWQKGAPAKDEILITQQRHHEALGAAISSCETVIAGLKSGISAEFVAADMRSALLSLSSIIGTNVTEDILSAIFSKFCLGK